MRTNKTSIPDIWHCHQLFWSSKKAKFLRASLRMQVLLYLQTNKQTIYIYTYMVYMYIYIVEDKDNEKMLPSSVVI